MGMVLLTSPQGDNHGAAKRSAAPRSAPFPSEDVSSLQGQGPCFKPFSFSSRLMIADLDTKFSISRPELKEASAGVSRNLSSGPLPLFRDDILF